MRAGTEAHDTGLQQKSKHEASLDKACNHAMDGTNLVSPKSDRYNRPAKKRTYRSQTTGCSTLAVGLTRKSSALPPHMHSHNSSDTCCETKCKYR